MMILWGMRALIVVSLLKYLTSWSAEHISILTEAPNLKIQHIIGAIMNAGRDRYEFNAAGAVVESRLMTRFNSF
jgi:hypothetical protein